MQEDRTYSEEDIPTLEAGDLTNPGVCSELLTAYYQNDTPRERHFTLKRDLNVFVPEARLREKLADLEGIENPGAEERADRLSTRQAVGRRPWHAGAQGTSRRAQPPSEAREADHQAERETHCPDAGDSR